MKNGTRALLAIVVLQALLLSAAMAKGDDASAAAAAKKKPPACWCGNCLSWSGVWTCDDYLTKCPSSCKQCNPVQTDKGRRYQCRDFLAPNCGCKAN